jgi:hypothetical protein
MTRQKGNSFFYIPVLAHYRYRTGTDKRNYFIMEWNIIYLKNTWSVLFFHYCKVVRVKHASCKSRVF